MKIHFTKRMKRKSISGISAAALGTVTCMISPFSMAHASSFFTPSAQNRLIQKTLH